MEQLQAGQHSPDLEWWWAEGRWHRAWSDDRCWWFDGATWRQQVTATQPKRSLPRLVKWGSLAWLGLWLASSVLGAVLAANPGAGDGSAGTFWAIVILVLAAAWIVGMLVWGYVLARGGHGTYLPVAVACVTGLLLAVYVVAMASTPDEGSDIAAGAGVAVGALPALVLVSLLVVLGAGAGHLMRLRNIRRLTAV